MTIEAEAGVMHFENGRRGVGQGIQQSLEAGKGQGMHSLPEPTEGT